MLGEHVDRLGALRASHPLGERCRELVIGHLVERGHDGGTDAGVQVGCRLRVERVDAQLEGGSQSGSASRRRPAARSRSSASWRRVQTCTPIVRWMLVPPSAVAECSQPRGT